MAMAAILLATINARYVHASLGLRCLAANMRGLSGDTEIAEFVLGQRPADIVESLLARGPRIVGFGVYIWNVEETTRVVALMKRVAPDVTLVLGGPEVSYELDDQRICGLADYVVTGWGDVTFPALCRDVLAGKPPTQKVIEGERAPLDKIGLPYDRYTDEDIAHRFIYVEASRGCPFRCEFCLSALDKTAWPFDLDAILAALAKLHARGARHFRFVDRTFNLKAAAGAAILEFFLARLDERLFLHFEVIPDHLPEKLKDAIARFPRGSLQFEVGIQSWNPQVQALISRKQDNAKAEENLRWLRARSNAFVHADLIAGLPGEDLESFARGFDRLHALAPHEIQVGILKRLRGTPIARHTGPHAMRWNPDPPYNVLATDRMSFATMQRVTRFARYWDMVANSGRFHRALPLLAGDAPFERFMRFSDWLYARAGRTHEIALERLCGFLHAFLTQEMGLEHAVAADALARDYEESGAKGRLAFMARGARPAPEKSGTKPAPVPARRARHLHA